MVARQQRDSRVQNDFIEQQSQEEMINNVGSGTGNSNYPQP
jgi:hypothetical protein